MNLIWCKKNILTTKSGQKLNDNKIVKSGGDEENAAFSGEGKLAEDFRSSARTRERAYYLPICVMLNLAIMAKAIKSHRNVVALFSG